jgi:HD-like signal output (HDOD) protein
VEIQCESALEDIPRLPFSESTIDKALKTEDLRELTEIIYSDLSTTVKILAAGNSAAVCRGGIETCCVLVALQRVGLNRARAILLGSIYSSILDTRLCPTFKPRTFWRDAALLGFATEAIANVTNHSCENIRSGAMSAGLLSKVGLLFLAHYYPKELNKSLFYYENDNETEISLKDLVYQGMGVDYDQLGVRMLAQWGLPKALVDVPAKIRRVGPSAKYGIAELVAITHLWSQDNYSSESAALEIFSEDQKKQLVARAPSFFKDAEMLTAAESAKVQPKR